MNLAAPQVKCSLTAGRCAKFCTSAHQFPQVASQGRTRHIDNKYINKNIRTYGEISWFDSLFPRTLRIQIRGTKLFPFTAGSKTKVKTFFFLFCIRRQGAGTWSSREGKMVDKCVSESEVLSLKEWCWKRERERRRGTELPPTDLKRAGT